MVDGAMGEDALRVANAGCSRVGNLDHSEEIAIQEQESLGRLEDHKDQVPRDCDRYAAGEDQESSLQPSPLFPVVPIRITNRGTEGEDRTGGDS